MTECSQCHDWLAQQFESLKRPNTNVQMLQKHSLLRRIETYLFLRQHAPDAARQLRESYATTMSAVYEGIFRAYYANLMQLHVKVATAEDTIVAERRVAQSFFSSLTADPGRQERTAAFALGRRAHVLREANQAPINPQLARSEGQRLTYEQVFRSVQRHLVQIAAGELAFCEAFFGASTAGGDVGGAARSGGGRGGSRGGSGTAEGEGRGVFSRVMSLAVSSLLEQVENHLMECHDSVAILLLIGVTQAHKTWLAHTLRQSAAQASKEARAAGAGAGGRSPAPGSVSSTAGASSPASAAPPTAPGGGSAGASGTDGASTASGGAGRASDPSGAAASSSPSRSRGSSGPGLAGRVEEEGASTPVTQELRDLDGAIPHTMQAYFQRVSMLAWPRFKAIFDANLKSVREANPARLGEARLEPHSATKRFAEFTATVLVLHRLLQRGGMADAMVSHNLAVLRSEMQSLLSRMSQSHRSGRHRLAFLIRQFGHCVMVCKERRVAEEDVQHFQDIVTTQTEMFVEQELQAHFKRLIQFVKQTEAATGAADGEGGGSGAGSAGARVQVSQQECAAVVRDFASSWRQALGRIHESVKGLFGDSPLAMEVLKAAYTQTLLYWTRVQQIVNRAFPHGPEFTRDMVAVPAIIAEIQRYSQQERGGGGGAG